MIINKDIEFALDVFVFLLECLNRCVSERIRLFW